MGVILSCCQHRTHTDYDPNPDPSTGLSHQDWFLLSKGRKKVLTKSTISDLFSKFLDDYPQYSDMWATDQTYTDHMGHVIRHLSQLIDFSSVASSFAQVQDQISSSHYVHKVEAEAVRGFKDILLSDLPSLMGTHYCPEMLISWDRLLDAVIQPLTSQSDAWNLDPRGSLLNQMADKGTDGAEADQEEG
ncbi:uncharacterized protein LOC106013620 [Aplysia californica]|uniref:Globin n=1 Tax=Aplysia californica TaxID=6500 RepID=A0ABM1ACX6_APLCA|nr:uncharacterized protein LOC106013620 [Aplysia californica]